jgi:hypothetical protein
MVADSSIRIFPLCEKYFLNSVQVFVGDHTESLDAFWSEHVFSDDWHQSTHSNILVSSAFGFTFADNVFRFRLIENVKKRSSLFCKGMNKAKRLKSQPLK